MALHNIVFVGDGFGVVVKADIAVIKIHGCRRHSGGGSIKGGNKELAFFGIRVNKLFFLDACMKLWEMEHKG